MSFSVTVTPYGRPAADLLAGQVRALKGDDPLAPVTVIVPATYAGIGARRHLAADGVAAVTFLTLQRLAERLAAAGLAASGRRPTPPALVTAAVRRVLAERPGVFGPVAGHPATEEALAAAYAELRGLSAGALDALASRGARARDVVRIHRAVRALLQAKWHDEHDLISAAADALGRPGALDSLGALIVHLPHRVAPATATLLRAVADHTTVTMNVGLSGDAKADAVVRAGLARAGVEVGDATWAAPRPRDIVTASDADEEVRAAVRAVVDAARSGVAFARMAVVWGAAEPYARILEAQLEAAGVPRNGTPVRVVADSVAGRATLGLLELPDRGFRRAEVMALLATAPVLGADGRLVPGRAWDRISREAGVVDGDDWDTRLGAHVARLEALAVEAEADDRTASAAFRREDATRARDLVRFVDDLRRRLSALGVRATWAEMAEGAAELLGAVLGDAEHRERWPEEERRAADRVEVAVAGLAGLDVIGGPAPDMEVFRRALAAGLAASLRRAGRFGEGVLVGPLSVVTGLELDRVIVLGIAEGTLPSARHEDSLLPDSDRAAAGGELPVRADVQQEDRHRFLAALAAAEHATLCFPRGDLRRPGERVASRWLLEAAAEVSGRAVVATKDLPGLDIVDAVPSFIGGLRRLEFPATPQEHNLSRLLGGGIAALADDPIVTAGAALSRARGSAEFTRFDGNLAGAGVPSPSASPVTSATRLEAWVSCPFRYFAEVALRVTVPEDPERILRMTALDRGSLVHEILDRFVRTTIAGASDDGDRLAALADEVFADYQARGVTGRPIFWRRDRAEIHRDLQTFVTEDRRRGTTPLRTELLFGPPDPVEVDLGDGRVIRFRGAADRVDDAGDGGLVVIDYKTGSPGSYKGLDAIDPTAHGRRFQLPVYALAARRATARPDAAVVAAYWFVTKKGSFDWIGFPVTTDVLDRVVQVLAAVDTLMAKGVFPMLPTAETFTRGFGCPFCDPDGLGPGERRRDWERKRSAPQLTELTELIGDA